MIQLGRGDVDTRVRASAWPAHLAAPSASVPDDEEAQPHRSRPELAEALAFAFDRMTQGLLLVEADARVTYASRPAQLLIKARRGLVVRRGVVQAEIRRDTLALHKAIAGCARDGASDDLPVTPLLLSTANDHSPILVMVTPLSHANPGGAPSSRPTAALFISDPELAILPDGVMLRNRFGLTRAEAAVALEVTKGDGIQACARRLGIAPTTARTQLKSVFAKTGAGRQAALTRMLVALASSVRAG